jgi:hypothetical protein
MPNSIPIVAAAGVISPVGRGELTLRTRTSRRRAGERFAARRYSRSRSRDDRPQKPQPRRRGEEEIGLADANGRAAALAFVGAPPVPDKRRRSFQFLGVGENHRRHFPIAAHVKTPYSNRAVALRDARLTDRVSDGCGRIIAALSWCDARRCCRRSRMCKGARCGGILATKHSARSCGSAPADARTTLRSDVGHSDILRAKHRSLCYVGGVRRCRRVRGKSSKHGRRRLQGKLGFPGLGVFAFVAPVFGLKNSKGWFVPVKSLISLISRI